VAAALGEFLDNPATYAATESVELSVGRFDAFVVPLRTHLVGAGCLVAFYERGTSPLPVEDRELFLSFA
jgi:hypothetical protein